MLSQYAQGDASLSARSERSVCGVFEWRCAAVAVAAGAAALYAARRFRHAVRVSGCGSKCGDALWSASGHAWRHCMPDRGCGGVSAVVLYAARRFRCDVRVGARLWRWQQVRLRFMRRVGLGVACVPVCGYGGGSRCGGALCSASVWVWHACRFAATAVAAGVVVLYVARRFGRGMRAGLRLGSGNKCGHALCGMSVHV